MLTLTSDELIRHYNLEPHPEGGFFRESYRAEQVIPQSVLPEAFQGNRAYSTAIYFLLPHGTKSSLHRIESDEIWHFYWGSPLTIIQISPEGQVKKTRLGPNISNGETLQYVVPAGDWFGAFPDSEDSPKGFSFVGCTVAPGFDFAEFTLADSKALIQQFPYAQTEIELLSPSS